MTITWMEAGRRPVRTAVLAHRGGAKLGRPNSLEVLERAKRAGATATEMDFQQTACGSLIAAHDSQLTRDGTTWWIRDQNLTKIEELTGDRPLTHVDVLEACRDLELGLYADIKSSGLPTLGMFAADCVRTGMDEMVCVGSSRADLVAFVAHFTTLDSSLMLSDQTIDPLAAAADLGCRFVHPCFDDAPAMIDTIEGAWMERLWHEGRGVVSWNTQDCELIERFVAAGMAAVCSDDPSLVVGATAHHSGQGRSGSAMGE